MNIRHQYVAVQVEKNRAHGRAMPEGIADYALAKTDWRLELVEPELLQDVSAVRKFDGLIVRVLFGTSLPGFRLLRFSWGSVFRFSAAIDERPADTLSVPVCTLASDKVAAFKAAFKFGRTTPNTGCRLVEKPAGEGRVTLVAEVYPSGLLMIVR